MRLRRRLVLLWCLLRGCGPTDRPSTNTIEHAITRCNSFLTLHPYLYSIYNIYLLLHDSPHTLQIYIYFILIVSYLI